MAAENVAGSAQLAYVALYALRGDSLLAVEADDAGISFGGGVDWGWFGLGVVVHRVVGGVW